MLTVAMRTPVQMLQSASWQWRGLLPHGGWVSGTRCRYIERTDVGYDSLEPEDRWEVSRSCDTAVEVAI
jgi:hypothetical protein